MEPLVRLILVTLLSYLVGSIPTALIVSKYFFGFDIRSKGSGNMGSTNAFRILGWRWGLFVQIIDILKGIVAVTVVTHLFDGILPFTNRTPFEDITVVRVIAGLSSVLGHVFTIFAGFKGGKGMNTATGMLIAVAPIEVSVAIVLFLLAVAFSGYISLGSVIAAIAVPTTMIVRYNIFGIEIPGYLTLVYFCAVVSFIVIYAHRSNIRRLIDGTESRFSKFQLFNRHH